VRSLVKAAPFPIELRDDLSGRLPAPVEATSYFVVSEALANATKHSHAGRGEVELAARNGTLHVTVSDNGDGGADPAGSGLSGLSDRVVAMGGEFEVLSPAGGGTVVSAQVPIRADG
jgi:signal transduction histidine kinase